MWIYILTFFLGVYVDLYCKKGSKSNKRMRAVFITWLFIFLCFSYTNGSDWRQYELEYDEGFLTYILQGRDLGFVALMNGFRYYISDFWIVAGLLKCIYLLSCIKVLKRYTAHWITALSIMMPLSLLYMLIDNPLRFMVAMIFVNFSIIKMMDSKYIYAVVLSIVALFCHSASLFCIALLPALRFDLFSKFKTQTLIAVYIALLVVSSSLDNILQLQKVLSDIQENYFGRAGLAEYYEAEDTDSIFTVGTLLNFVLFSVILKYRHLLTKKNSKLFSASILYFYVFNIAHVMPGGHRIRMAFTLFCGISYVIIMLHNQKIRYALSILFCIMLMKNIWGTYSYLPYTNSIPYIFTKHLPYSERSNYNPSNYKERTGRDLPSEE